MSKIIEYIIRMTPFMLLALIAFVIIRIIINRKKKEKINWYREIGLLLFVMFITGLASQTIIPEIAFTSDGIELVQGRVHETNLIPFKVVTDTYYQIVVNGNWNSLIINVIGNIIMFMPIGFFIPLLWNIKKIYVILIGAGSSLFIEFCQLFLSRGTDIDDIILNTIGAVLGLVVCNIINKIFYKTNYYFKNQK